MTFCRVGVLFAVILSLSACVDNGVEPQSPGEVPATLHLPQGRAALVLEVVPARALDSLLVGPPAYQENAYLVSRPVAGRVLVYSHTTLATQIRMRAFLAEGYQASSIHIRVLSTATPDGMVDEGHEAAVSFGS